MLNEHFWLNEGTECSVKCFDRKALYKSGPFPPGNMT